MAPTSASNVAAVEGAAAGAAAAGAAGAGAAGVGGGWALLFTKRVPLPSGSKSLVSTAGALLNASLAEACPASSHHPSPAPNRSR